MEFETDRQIRTAARRAGSCKFTPLEFETLIRTRRISKIFCVNLLRWSLKPILETNTNDYKDMCKFTPLEFETFR